ncbi:MULTISPECIES: glutamine amidotransferase-related protein [Phenylobacterium]|uniref:GMP synthase-like glutamine amidotransferase n=1 Tax=Phenylobacterium koreense TaxID=266125 RepID=A0ABV2EFC2_9CAUL
MKLGILETGAPPEDIRGRFGGYPGMFRKLLGEQAYDYAVFDVQAGRMPQGADACGAYVVTGSSAGVYDPEPWIEPLMDFLREAKGKLPLVGVCFGHQIMAQAFGGKVIKSPKGWGVGLHRYRLSETRDWMDSAEPIAIPASHQDQVVELAPGARAIGGSEFCPNGMIDYGEARAISIQLHPEFEPAYAKALIENRRGTRYTDEEADRAVMSYEQPDDRLRVGAWLQRFIEQG